LRERPRLASEMRRILFYNPNSSVSVTERILDVASRHARADTEVCGYTSSSGPAYIGSSADLLQAAAAALTWVKSEAAKYDAVVVACFGDTGIATLRQVASVPLIGLVESSVMAAQMMGDRYSIVTGGDEWRRLLPPMLNAIGQQSRLASIRTLGRSALQMMGNPAEACRMLAAVTQAALDEDGADVVILGGAAIAGMDVDVQAAVSGRVIDSIAPAVWMADALVRSRSTVPLDVSARKSRPAGHFAPEAG